MRQLEKMYTTETGHEEMGQAPLTIDSREVATMTGMRHSDLLEKIGGSKKVKGYVEILENGKFRSQDFFIKDSYKAEGNNKTYDCYQLTRKGCDMVANKLTGKKGVLFTAAYVTKFEEMEKELSMQKFNLPTNYKEALLQLVAAEEEKEKLLASNKEKEEQLKIAAPKLDLYEDFMSMDNLYSVGQLAKCFAIKGMGKNNLFKWLRWNKIFMDGYEAYQRYVTDGKIVHRERTYCYGKGENKRTVKDICGYFTPKGVQYIYNKLRKDGYVSAKSLSTVMEELQNAEMIED